MSGPFHDDDFPAAPLTSGKAADVLAPPDEPEVRSQQSRIFVQVPTPCLRRRCLMRDLGPMTAGWWATTAFALFSASSTDLAPPIAVLGLALLGVSGWLTHLQVVLARRTRDVFLPPLTLDGTTLHVPGPRGRINRLDLAAPLCVEPVLLQTRPQTPALFLRQDGRSVLIEGTPGDVPAPAADWPPMQRPLTAYDSHLSSIDLVRIEATIRRVRSEDATRRPEPIAG